MVFLGFRGRQGDMRAKRDYAWPYNALLAYHFKPWQGVEGTESCQHAQQTAGRLPRGRSADASQSYTFLTLLLLNAPFGMAHRDHLDKPLQTIRQSQVRPGT